jgi:hypothetical protein
MKQKILLAITFAIACSFITKSFSYTIWAIDPKSGIANVALEKSTAVIQTKGKTSTTSSSYTISNATSTIRIKINNAAFQSALNSQNTLGNVNDYITLYKLSSGKTNRSFTINTDGTTNGALIAVNFTPTETRTYTKISPTQALIPGEYAFVDMSTKTADGNITVWTFGIDN